MRSQKPEIKLGEFNVIEQAFAEIPDKERNAIIKSFAGQMKKGLVQTNVYVPLHLMVVMAFYHAFDRGKSKFILNCVESYVAQRLAPGAYIRQPFNGREGA